ncbi:uncharacterized protein LOC125670196 isoform X1 [Ostrea edulis]|uniref:uncharacterized protein LOC125670196 isoform X1 n=1 Tax=Ostrea edulis TaxID=37623 RepID=UPI0024AFCFE9|nr:uncharacterized protein LOC125670196 isoform X1 [Ostrea edulis]
MNSNVTMVIASPNLLFVTVIVTAVIEQMKRVAVLEISEIVRNFGAIQGVNLLPYVTCKQHCFSDEHAIAITPDLFETIRITYTAALTDHSLKTQNYQVSCTPPPVSCIRFYKHMHGLYQLDSDQRLNFFYCLLFILLLNK